MSDDLLGEATEILSQLQEAWSENYDQAQKDIEFAWLGEQWPEKIEKQRKDDGRPCLVMNRLPAFVRQIVNDARQNKPGIKTRPVDSEADVMTAKAIDGLVRNIEQVSKADIAYDTAAEFAAYGGIGWLRVAVEYSYDDSFEKDIKIKRVVNPFSVYLDQFSIEGDGCDANDGFVLDTMSRAQFKRRYPGAEVIDFSGGDYRKLNDCWKGEDNSIVVAEWWRREETKSTIYLVRSGDQEMVLSKEHLEEYGLAEGQEVAAEREVPSYAITHRLMTGVEILETNDWAGKYIPIVPVFGADLYIRNKHRIKGHVHDAMDAQRYYNYWRTATTELVALAPRAPFIGPETAFEGKDALKWQTANTENHSYLSYKGNQPPQRQHFEGVPAGSMQEALSASDDMKAIMGMYDASLGQRSNETSGKAIIARQREGDVSTFHIVDNLSRAIRQVGNIIIDLIPSVYSKAKMIRVLGEDGTAKTIPLGQETPVMSPDGKPQVGDDGQALTHVYNLTVGKYDVAVDVGPSYTTKREEAATQMIELLRAFPQAAPVIGDLLAKNLDWPGADEIAERLRMLVPEQARGQDPEMQKLAQALQEVTEKLRQLETDRSIDMQELQIKAKEVEVKQFEAETDRMKVRSDAILRERDLTLVSQPSVSAAL